MQRKRREGGGFRIRVYENGTKVSGADGTPLDIMIQMAETGGDVPVINQLQKSMQAFYILKNVTRRTSTKKFGFS